MAASASTPRRPTPPVDRCMSANGNNPLARSASFSFVDILSAFTVLRPQHCHHHGLSHLPSLSGQSACHTQPPTTQQAATLCSKSFLHSSDVLLNIDQPSSCCLLTPRFVSRFQKSKAATFSKTRISYEAIGEKLGPIHQILVLSKLSVLNFS